MRGKGGGGGGDNQVEAVEEKKLGIGLVKWMGEDKDVYGRKGSEVV